MKKLILFLASLFVLWTITLIYSTESNAQKIGKEYHDKLQKENSWENYQATYKKTMLSNAKESKKQKRDAKKAEKQKVKFLARIERIKG